MKKLKTLTLLLIALFAGACSSVKRLTYIQDMEPGIDYPVADRPMVRIDKGDKLGILVTCNNPALAAPFNMVSGIPTVNGSSGEVSYQADAETGKGYMVDDSGDIDFPVLGKVHVAGLTLDDVKLAIENGIRESNYIKEPVVEVEFKNFEIVILGETGPSVMGVPDGQINIFQAIAKSGDLRYTAVRKDVRVIRLEDGVRRVYSLDLTNSSCFDSPAYYLKQNDMVYVKPNRSVRDNIQDDPQRRTTMLLSIITSISSALYWTTIAFSTR